MRQRPRELWSSPRRAHDIVTMVPRADTALDDARQTDIGRFVAYVPDRVGLHAFLSCAAWVRIL
jgi:hypothetical protein